MLEFILRWNLSFSDSGKEGMPWCCIYGAIPKLELEFTLGLLIRDDLIGGAFTVYSSSTLMVLFHTGSLLGCLLEFFFISWEAVRDWYLADLKELNLFTEELLELVSIILFKFPVNLWFLYLLFTLSILKEGIVTYFLGSSDDIWGARSKSSYSSLKLIEIGLMTSTFL